MCGHVSRKGKGDMHRTGVGVGARACSRMLLFMSLPVSLLVLLVQVRSGYAAGDADITVCK